MRALSLPNDGAFLRYHDLPGREPALLYLHCLGGAAATLLAVAREPALMARRALLPDFLGFGYSDRPTTFDYTLAGHARTVAALLEHHDLHGCAIIGHSLGGSVAIALAAARPDLVSQLILIEAPLYAERGGASATIAAQTESLYTTSGHAAFLAPLATAAHAGDATLAAFLGAFQAAAPHAVYHTAASLVAATPALRDHLARLPLPRAYLWGARTLDDPDAARQAGDLAQQGIRVATVPASGHHPNLDNPTGLAAVLDTILGDFDIAT